MSPSPTRWQPTYILLTCEHGGRDVPLAYKRLFRGQKPVLDSHRGYDIGALGVALRMAPRLAAPVLFSTVTRLLVDLNRSIDQPDAFSEFTAPLPARERERIVEAFYTPHRDAAFRIVASAVAAGHRVLHMGVHSCTDVLRGQRRELDIALLFDDARPLEAGFAERYRASLVQHAGDLRFPFNEPYRGADDGLTTALRGSFAAESYLGIEIEVRQGMILTLSEQHAAGDLLADALLATVPPRITA